MILKVRVRPNAKKSEILEDTSDVLKVAIAAPPDKNKANKELVRFLSKHFKKTVRIKSGLTSRMKVVEFA